MILHGANGDWTTGDVEAAQRLPAEARPRQESQTTRMFRKSVSGVLDPSALTTFEQEGYSVTTLPPFQRFRGLHIPWDKPEDLVEESEAVRKCCESRKVVHLAAGQYALPVEVHVKRYTLNSLFKRTLYLGRRSRARKEFELGWKLLEQKIKTPRPVWLAEGLGPHRRHSMIATESIPGAESAFERWKRCANERQRHELIVALGQFTAVLHDKGFVHDNYKSGHVLILPTRPSMVEEFHLIDLRGGGFSGGLSTWVRARHLFQLIQSFIPAKHSVGFKPEHRQLLLRSYCGSPAETAHWETWVSRVSRFKGKRLDPL